MRRLLVTIATLLSVATIAGAQIDSQSKEFPPDKKNTITLPAGTKILLVMKNGVSSKNAKAGDGVYLESSFPVVRDGMMVVPAGTYVQGVVDKVQRSGRVKGRAEVLMHFNTLIYPNGYTVTMPGSVENTSGDDSHKVKDQEGTIQAEGTKGKDAGAIATAAGTGGLIGGLSHGAQGAAIGGAVGAAVGVLTTLFTRGEEVRLEPGSTVEMVLERPMELEIDRITGQSQRTSNLSPPVQHSKKLTLPEEQKGPHVIAPLNPK